MNGAEYATLAEGRRSIKLWGETIMKSEIILSPRELLYIAALLEAAEFLGVSDAFFGMDDAEIQHEMMNLQSSLEEKGYAEMDFDGSFTLREDVREMVDICANCDTFIIVDKNKVEQSQLRDLYYSKSGSIVKLSEGADGNILTPMLGTDGLLEHISEGMEWQTPDASSLRDIRITNEILSDVKEKASGIDPLGSVKTLVENGCDEPSAKAIINGLIGKSDYYAVIITVFGSEREGVYNVMLTSGESGIYRLTPIVGEEQEATQFNMLSAAEVKLVLSDIVRAAFPPESEGFA